MAKVAEIKTKQNNDSVNTFLDSLENGQQADSKAIIKMMEKATGEPPKMWGKSMVGFGLLRYKSQASGREVDWFKIGFAPRKNNISLHLVTSMEKQAALLEKLGKHKTGKGCLYINSLKDVDVKVLEKLIGIAAK